jgi:nucleotide-binding universal stress UspA family protein
MRRGEPFRRIVHASDFSRASARALTLALALARSRGARLTVVHVLTPPSPFVGGELSAAPTWQALEARGRRAARRGLARLAARAARVGVRVEPRLLEGPPAEAITGFARRRGADLVVIGTHGRTGLRRALMGSVAARVLALASCPVLTVRGRA